MTLLSSQARPITWAEILQTKVAFTSSIIHYSIDKIWLVCRGGGPQGTHTHTQRRAYMRKGCHLFFLGVSLPISFFFSIKTWQESRKGSPLRKMLLVPREECKLSIKLMQGGHDCYATSYTALTGYIPNKGFLKISSIYNQYSVHPAFSLTPHT